MRIEGNFTLQQMNSKTPTQFESGDIVRGKVIISDADHIQIETSQGLQLNARLSDGVQLETGSNVKLLIGGKIDGVATAKVLERTDDSVSNTTGTLTARQEVAQAFRDLGVRAVPQLIESAMKLISEKNMDSRQAAFVSANEFGDDAKSIQMLQRILDGQFGFSENWNKLSGAVSDTVLNMPESSRTALMQPLVLSELLDKIVSNMNPANTAISNVLKDVLIQWSQQMPNAENALTQLQEALSAVNGGKAFVSSLSSEAFMNMNINSLNEVIQLLQGQTSGSGSTIPQMNGGQLQTQVSMEQILIQPNSEQLSAQVNSQINSGQNNANQQIPMHVNGEVNQQTALNQMEALSVQSSVNQQGSTSQPGAENQQNPGVPQNQANLQRDVNAPGSSGSQTMENLPITANLQTLTQAQAITIPQTITNSQTMTNINNLLEQLSNAIELSLANAALDSTGAKALITKAFDGAALKLSGETGSANALPDIAKMTQVAKEQLEWSSRVLSQTDTSAAAVLRPMIEDAVGAMRLFQQISTYQTFVQVPIQLNDQHAQGELYVMKRKGNRGKIDASDFTLFLSLDTENLGHLESLAHAKNKQVSLHFQVDNTDIQNMLRETRQTLFEGLKKKGFSLIDMKVRIQEEQVTPLNAFIQAEKRLGRVEGFDIKI